MIALLYNEYKERITVWTTKVIRYTVNKGERAMSEKKDYLSVLADEANAKKKPDSFQEEKFERIEKPKMKLDPKLLIGAMAGLVIIIAAAYFLFLSPKITMPDFIEKTKNDIAIWAKQEGLKTSGIIIVEEYNFDVSEGLVVSQSIEPEKKIKSDTVITFYLSLGADPDEKVDFPDMESLTLSEINEWISTNKLSRVKVNTVFSDTVEENNVISYDLKSVNENNFTRGTNLTINVSKGVQPAVQVTMEDFVRKDLATVQSFADSKKITLKVVEVYSDDIAAGMVVFQSVKSGETMKQGETLTVHVSKGKAITVPNFSTYNVEMLAVWRINNPNLMLIEKEIYSDNNKGNVISQSISAGTKVEEGTAIAVTISLGKPRLQTSSLEWYGKDYLEMHIWAEKTRDKGSQIFPGNWLENQCDPELPKNIILKYECLDANDKILTGNCDFPMPLNGKISYSINVCE